MTTKKPPRLTGVYDPALDEPELTPQETAAALRRAAAAKRALRRYLTLVQEIPEVVEVRRAEDNRLCTVISADPLDDQQPSYRVFDAQTALILAFDDQPFDFRLLNYQALTMQQRDAHIAGYGDLVWRRRPESAPPEEDAMAASPTRDDQSAPHPALSKYLELLREIPEVVEVRRSDDNELYAIISSDTPDAAVSYQVYRAEGKVMDAIRPQPFRFRLVNRRQLPPAGRAAQIRSFGELVWRRQ